MIRNDRTTIRAALCAALALGSPWILRPTPDAMVLSVAKDIAAADRLVFFQRHFHSTAYRLGRKTVSPIAGAWTFPAKSLPDNQYRELIEGAEAMADQAKTILIDDLQLQAMIAAPGVTWILAEAPDLAKLQALGATAVHIRDQNFVLLKAGR